MTSITARDRVRAMPSPHASWLDTTAATPSSTFLRKSPLDAATIVLEAILGVAVFAFFGVMFDSVIAGAF